MKWRGHSEYGEDDRWFTENNRRVSEAFNFPDFDECPCLRGELGLLVKDSLRRQVFRVAAEMVEAIMDQPRENLVAFHMHLKGSSFRQIGKALGVDHKTAKSRVEAVQSAMSGMFPHGECRTANDSNGSTSSHSPKASSTESGETKSEVQGS